MNIVVITDVTRADLPAVTLLLAALNSNDQELSQLTSDLKGSVTGIETLAQANTPPA